MIKQREIWKKEQLAVDKTLFDQRDNLISVKQNLPDQYKEGDEDLLITQKVKTAMTQDERSRTNDPGSKRKSPWISLSVYQVVNSNYPEDRMAGLQKPTCYFCLIG